MKIIVPKNAGVCWGVERAIEMAEEVTHRHAEAQAGHPEAKVCHPEARSAEGSSSALISSLGPLVHNPEVVEDFQKKGVQVISDLKEASGGTVIFRSHGVPVELYGLAKEKSLNVVDATCPFVKKSQNFARRLHKHGYVVIVVGDENHPEMKSVKSFIPGEKLITMNPKDIEKIEATKKVGIIAQTTIPKKTLDEMVDACQARFQEVKVHDTICDATKVRQEEAAEVAAQVECMIIIGGENSSNTKKLTHICKTLQPKSYQIEHEREIDFSWFEGIQTLGITAGASTPVPVIHRVKQYIEDVMTSA